MLTAQSSRDINQAARSAAKYLKDVFGLDVPHAKALDLVARTLGKPHHMAAVADLPAPAPATQALGHQERTPQDYAIEHGGYLATSAKHLLEALNAEFAARTAVDDAEEGELEQRESELTAATESLSDAIRGLQSGIYEFEKRRDRALASKAVQAVPGAEPDTVKSARAVIEDLCKVLTPSYMDASLRAEGISDAAYAAMAAALPFVEDEWLLKQFPLDVVNIALGDIPDEASPKLRGLAQRLMALRPKTWPVPSPEKVAARETMTESERLALQFELATGEPGAVVFGLVADNGLEGAIREVNKRYEIGMSMGPWLIASDHHTGFWVNDFGWCYQRNAASGFSDADVKEMGPSLAERFGSYARFVKYEDAFDYDANA